MSEKWIDVVLVIAVDQPRLQRVLDTLAIVRTVLVSSHLVADEPPGIGFWGPFAVSETDSRILEALAYEYEDVDKGADEREPDIIKGRAVRKMARDAVGIMWREAGADGEPEPHGRVLGASKRD